MSETKTSRTLSLVCNSKCGQQTAAPWALAGVQAWICISTRSLGSLRSGAGQSCWSSGHSNGKLRETHALEYRGPGSAHPEGWATGMARPGLAVGVAEQRTVISQASQTTLPREEEVPPGDAAKLLPLPTEASLPPPLPTATLSLLTVGAR